MCVNKKQRGILWQLLTDSRKKHIVLGQLRNLSRGDHMLTGTFPLTTASRMQLIGISDIISTIIQKNDVLAGIL